MRSRKSSFFDDLALAPWPIGVAMGCLVLAAGWVVPALVAGSANPFIAGVGKALASGALDPAIYVVTFACWLAAALSAWRRAQRRKLLDSRSDLESLRAMSWRQLEHLVSEAYRRLGFEVEEGGGRGADGGVDLRLRRHGELTLVQCKQWRTQRVGAPVVREQFGLLAHHQAKAVIILTVGDFTSEARAFAQGKPIELVAGPELLALVKGVQREPSAGVPSQIRPAMPEPTCPKCDSPMVRRTARQTGSAFLGCSRFPACRGTRPV